MKASNVLIILICLLTTAVFSVLYVYRYVYQKDLVADTVRTSHSVADAAAGGDTSTNASPLPETFAPPAVSYSVLPRAPYTYDGVSVGVTGTKGDESLLDYFAFGGNVYAVVAVDTDGEDYRATSPSIGVARFDGACTLYDSVTLADSAGYSYLAACLYDYGLVLVAASSTQLKLWWVGANLSVRSVAYPYVVSAAKAVYDNGRVVVCATGGSVHLLAFSADESLLFYHTAPAEGKSICELYAYAGEYIALCGDAYAAFAFRFDADGYLSRAVLPAVDAITPYRDGFAIANVADAKLYLFDYRFARTGELSFSRAQKVLLCSYDNGVLLLACGTQTTGYLLCNHAEVQYSFAFDAQGVAQLQYAEGRFYFAAATLGSVKLYAYAPFDDAPVVVASFLGAVNTRIWGGRYLYCLCESQFTYGYFSGCLGGRDVYLLRMDNPLRR